MLDFHNHMIPGVDDGCRSIDESLQALRAMQEQGVTHVITTPHFRASTLLEPARFEERMGKIDAAWEALRAALASSGLTVRIDRGVELALDAPRLPALDARVRLAGTRNVLVEFPSFSVPPNSAEALLHLRVAGLLPIVAHPERYENLVDGLETMHAWRRSGAALQVNAGSLTGYYGGSVQKRAWAILAEGSYDFLCSDFHGRGDCLLDDCGRLMRERGAEEQFGMLTSVNGSRLLAGQDPLPVSPLATRGGLWSRVKGMLGR